MIVFLIVVAVIVLIFAIIFSLSATITIVHDKGWSTKVSVLWIEKDIVLSDILSLLLFPDKKGQEAAEAANEKKEQKKQEKEKAQEEKSEAKTVESKPSSAEKTEKAEPEKEESKEEKQNDKKEEKPAKSNPIKKIWDDEGIVGILSFATNLMDTANSALITLFKGLHIYSLYVMIIVGGGDADVIAQRYGNICRLYYPVKGIILNGMKVDNYDDIIEADYIAPATVFEMQFIASISIGLLVRMLLRAGFVFLKNYFANKKR